MALPTITVTPQVAADAYRRADSGGAAATGSDFGSVLASSLQDVVDAGHAAEAQSAQAIAGHADITSVVTAVSKAELALQTTVAIRDRVVQAYQEIMRMPL
ncbi:MAG: flagellar hook-basal body complex protein FliE [Acidisphaera sp.]|nr:flagellar hook-basal body complex protein FliE [Acidisphaera sp.]MBV9813667.1 flagellar hook-basal body complex protein FliE [Acetobacteraceae bacterium]